MKPDHTGNHYRCLYHFFLVLHTWPTFCFFFKRNSSKLFLQTQAVCVNIFFFLWTVFRVHERAVIVYCSPNCLRITIFTFRSSSVRTHIRVQCVYYTHEWCTQCVHVYRLLYWFWGVHAYSIYVIQDNPRYCWPLNTPVDFCFFTIYLFSTWFKTIKVIHYVFNFQTNIFHVSTRRNQTDTRVSSLNVLVV